MLNISNSLHIQCCLIWWPVNDFVMKTTDYKVIWVKKLKNGSGPSAPGTQPYTSHVIMGSICAPFEGTHVRLCQTAWESQNLYHACHCFPLRTLSFLWRHSSALLVLATTFICRQKPEEPAASWETDSRSVSWTRMFIYVFTRARHWSESSPIPLGVLITRLLITAMRAIYPVQLILLGLVTLPTFGEEYNPWSSRLRHSCLSVSSFLRTRGQILEIAPVQEAPRQSRGLWH